MAGGTDGHAGGAKSRLVGRHDSAEIRRTVPILQVASAVAAIRGREPGSVVVSRVAIRAEIHFSGGG